MSRLTPKIEVRGNPVSFGALISGKPARGVQLLLLVIAVCAGSYARTAIGPLQEALGVALVLTDNQMALLQGPALALPFVLFAVPLGLFIDRYSRARMILLVGILDAACSFLTAVAPNFLMLFVARCLIGLTAFAVNPIVLSLIADLYVPAQRGRATMAITIGQFAGMSSAFALGGALIAAFASSPAGWRWAMLWLTAPLVLVMFLMLAAREPARTQVLTTSPSLRDVVAELRQYRGVITPLLIGIIMLEICLGAMLVWSAPTLSRGFALASDGAGAIVATGLVVSGVLGPIAGGVLADICQSSGGPRRTMSLLAILAAVSVPACLFPVASGIALVSGLLVLLMTTLSAMIVIGSTLFTVIVPGELRGLCMGMLAGVCVLFGIGIAPLTTSLLSGAMGGPVMIGRALAIICVFTNLACTGTFAFGRRYFPLR